MRLVTTYGTKWTFGLALKAIKYDLCTHLWCALFKVIHFYALCCHLASKLCQCRGVAEILTSCNLLTLFTRWSRLACTLEYLCGRSDFISLSLSRGRSNLSVYQYRCVPIQSTILQILWHQFYLWFSIKQHMQDQFIGALQFVNLQNWILFQLMPRPTVSFIHTVRLEYIPEFKKSRTPHQSPLYSSVAIPQSATGQGFLDLRCNNTIGRLLVLKSQF